MDAGTGLHRFLVLAAAMALAGCSLAVGLKDRQLAGDDGGVAEAGEDSTAPNVDSGRDAAPWDPGADATIDATSPASDATAGDGSGADTGAGADAAGDVAANDGADEAEGVDAGDAAADASEAGGGCNPDSPSTTCSKHGAVCGKLTTTDNCAQTVTVDCGNSCTCPQVCAATNTCATPACMNNGGACSCAGDCCSPFLCGSSGTCCTDLNQGSGCTNGPAGWCTCSHCCSGCSKDGVCVGGGQCAGAPPCN
jgi:hypothetical protein